jgi:magnesium transporter
VTETPSRLEVEDLQRNLREVESLLHRQRLVEGLVERQEMPRHDLVEKLVHKQHLAELRAKLEKLHSADIAYILEALPLDERQIVWDLVKTEREGEILLELSDAVRESLIATMDSKELLAAAGTLEADQIADLAPDLPEQVVQDVIRALPQEEREQLRAALSYKEGTVGALMDFEQIIVLESSTARAGCAARCRWRASSSRISRSSSARRWSPKACGCTRRTSPMTLRRPSSATTWPRLRWPTTSAGWSAG